RQRSLQNECSIVTFLFYLPPALDITGQFVLIRLIAVSMDGLYLERNYPVHIGTPLDDLSGEWFEHQVNVGRRKGLSKVSEKRHGQNRITDKSITKNKKFSTL